MSSPTLNDVITPLMTYLTGDRCDGSRGSVVDSCHAIASLALSGALGKHPNTFAAQLYTEVASKIPSPLPLAPACDLPALAREPRKITIPVIKEHLKACGSKVSGTKVELLKRIPTTLAPPRLYKILPRWRREEAALQAHFARRREVEKRQRILELAFAPRELTIRADSELCRQYTEWGRGDPAYIARVMDEMRFYFARTDYDKIRNGMYQAQREYRSYNDDYFDFPIDGQQLSRDAKKEAMKRYLGTLTTQKKIDEALCDFMLPPSLRPMIPKM